MNILVTGSSGLIGSALTPFLRARGHQVRRLLRAPTAESDATSWNPAAGTFTEGALDGIDAVVHLAGESIASGRWTAARKARIRDSRVDLTRRLSETLARLESPPTVLVAASAIGFYGDRGDEVLDEAASPRAGFLPDVCQAWRTQRHRRASGASGSRICGPGSCSARTAGRCLRCFFRSGSVWVGCWGRAIST